jgi:acyl-CoA thioester hydrolase
MFRHIFQKRIRYGETDKMGYLYYGHYPLMYEIGRVEAIRDLGLTYRHMEDELRIMMPVIHVESRYLKPAYYDELIFIHTILNEIPGKLCQFEHEIYNEGEELIHKATVKLFFIDMDTQKRVSAPDYFTDALKTYF